MKSLTDLREILRYVPQYRDKAFVIALDGAIVADDNFPNLILDIALLRSLRVGVVLVHGAGWQIQQLATRLGRIPSNIDGTGITNSETLDLALTAANRVSHQIIEGLTAVDLRAIVGNSVVANPAGILGGVDYQFSGRVERIDVGLLQAVIERDIIPVVPPLGIDGEGHTFRLNSDAVAVEVALAMKAAKLIYLGSHEGVQINGETMRQLRVGEAEHLLKRAGSELPVGVRSKLSNAVRATLGGIPRVHIIDGREREGLLAEVFSFQGIGTLVYANEYQSIRPAQKKDVRAIYNLIQQGVRNDELLQRSRAEIERQISDFYVFEVDRSPVACVALHSYAESQQAELACLYVSNQFENQGIAARLVQYVENVARAMGAEQIFCLSTQAYNYFTRKAGFKAGSPTDLPESRRDRYNRSGRRSQVLVKDLIKSSMIGH